MSIWNRLKKVLNMPWAAYTFAICSGVLLFLFLSNIEILWHAIGRIFHYFYPVILGIIIAYVLDPGVKFLEQTIFRKIKKRSVARGLGVVIVFTLIIFLLTILIVAMVPQVVSSIRMFIENLSGYASSLNKMLNDLQIYAADHNVDISNFTDSAGGIIGMVTDMLPQSLNGVLNTTINYGVEIFNIIIASIIAIYILMDKTRLLEGSKRLWKALTNEQSYQTSNNFLGRCNSIMLQYIVCDLLDGMIVGTVNAIFMLIVRYPYVPLISVIVGVTNLAPTFGPIFGFMIGGSILLLINPWYALGFLIFTIALQMVDGYILKPKFFGGQLGIPSIWILIALIVFGRMWGMIGILFAIPFAAILDFVYGEEVLPRLERRKKKIDAARRAAKSASQNKK